MVNNAEIAEYADVEKITAEIWDKTIAVNLTGTMWGTKLGIENNEEQRGKEFDHQYVIHMKD
ncbi:3-beta-hydroxysteroid dehydrogenase [Limosilactobacillus reuteri]|uniref:3-beta-hydroxysteroid dehydrogenase n=1 Tax=Limosilactobacillus reuteri TaxID=1598 RepID=A0A2S1ETH0_LIMRT|nr:3-beta-hydroxysteroid dehydrogenase [Limosilactobacillus reuteri]